MNPSESTAEGKPAYAEVAVPLPVETPLTYALPEGLREAAAAGKRALVPVGARLVTGMIVGLTDTAGRDALRPVQEILDPEPLLDAHLLALTAWVAEYYMAPWGLTIRAALPPGMDAGTRLVAVAYADPGPEELAHLDPAEARLWEALQASGQADLRGLVRRFGEETARGALRGLVRRGLVAVQPELRAPRVKPRTEAVCSLTDKGAAEAGLPSLQRRAPQQAALLTRLLELGSMTRQAADALAGAGAVRGLLARGLLRLAQVEAPRRPHAAPPPPDGGPLAPTPEQAAALDRIAAAIEAGTFQPILLHGVTGSGKTEVYLQAIARVLAAGRTALVLVPEIALTPLTVARFRARFGDAVAVLHSKLSPGERLDEWLRVRRGGAPIAVGARSAVFAPLPRLGLVVVDEEHDPSYKQEDVPRYHARDVALRRGELLHIPVLLGSATPSLESYQAARAAWGRDALLCLPHRIEARPLPAVTLVDMRRERAPGPYPFLSPRLRLAIRDRLERGEQALLFLNRRGFSSLLLCRACGHTVACPRCSVSLTFHAAAQQLRCHYCGARRRPPDVCPACGGATLRFLGIGTQQVEQAVRALFPDAAVARMDRDTARGYRDFEVLLDRLARREVQVLVGTQMIGKGHDFPGITLVGILAADLALNLPDFRATERTFALLTQVIGRAGRGGRPGEALVQTYNPEHYALRAVAAGDYLPVFEAEAAQRQEQGLPPYAALLHLQVAAPTDGAAEKAAHALAFQLQHTAPKGDFRTEGPAPAPIARLRGRFRWQLLVLGSDRVALRRWVREALAEFRKGEAGRPAQLHVDPDPVVLC
jgi:primosomal protein N' (replication factor Y)